MPHLWTIAKAFGQPAQVNQPAADHDPLPQGALHGEGGGRRLRDRRRRRLRARDRPRPLAAPATRLPAVHRREPDDPDPRDRADGRRLGQPEAARPVQGWGAVAVIAAYLTFFPVVINTLRGLHSADPRALELMRTYAAGRWSVLWKLRVPASLPYRLLGAPDRRDRERRRRDHRRAAFRPAERPRRRDPQLQPVLLDRAAGALGDERDRGAPRRHLLRRSSSAPSSSSSAAHRRRRMSARNRRPGRGRHEDVPARATSRRCRTSTSSSTPASSSR